MESIRLSSEARQELTKEIRRYFTEERDEELSDFQAENFLQFVLAAIGPAVYNQAIEDAYVLMNEKSEELFGLQKRAEPRNAMRRSGRR